MSAPLQTAAIMANSTPTVSPSVFPGVTPETLIISSERDNGSHMTHLEGLESTQQSLSFILVPIILILSVAFFSGVAIYCIQRRQRLDNLRHTLIPLYSFNKEDEDEWGVLLDNCGTSSKHDRRERESRGGHD